MIKSGSLRLRLILAASVAISVALAIAGGVLYYRFQNHVERLVLQQFNLHYQEIATSIVLNADGVPEIEHPLSDPRFDKQRGGLYWQVDIPGAPSLRSRSLWEEALVIPTPPLEGEDDHIHDLKGPDGMTLLGLERLLKIEKPDGQILDMVVTIAQDKTDVENALTGFGNELGRGLFLLYLALLASTAALIIHGLRPLEAVRRSLEDVRRGAVKRMSDAHPAEVQPLVTELNTLLDARGEQLARARERAGNLAHGLKTPLTVLDAISSEIRASGNSRAAQDISDATQVMQALIDRELMRSRSSSAPTLNSTVILPLLAKIVAALKKTSDKTGLSFEVAVLPQAALPIEAGDAMELFGNLLDNAHKHARQKIRIEHSDRTLVIEDDGPGVSSEQFEKILARGVKLDERKAGFGLGLAIVHDLLESYGATLKFDRSPLGGLRVAITF